MSGGTDCGCTKSTERVAGLPSPGPAACECGTAERSDAPPRDPTDLPVARSPGSPTPITRFDLHADLARRGIPVAYPQGYDPRVPLPRPGSTPEPPADPVVPGLDRGADGLLPPPAAPDFIDRNVLPRESKISGVGVASPGGRASGPARSLRAAARRAARFASPDGTALDCGAPAPAMAPDGTSGDCALWAVAGTEPEDRQDAVGPPEYFPDFDSLLSSSRSSHEAARERELRRRRELEQRARALASAPVAVVPGVGGPADEDTQAPGAAPCTKDPGFQTPASAEPSGVGPPGVEQYRGKGGPTDIYRPYEGPAGAAPPGDEKAKDDPCPCKCVCVPLFPCGPFIFQPGTGTTQSVSGLFGPDRGFFGGTEGLPPPERPVVATENGLIYQVRTQLRLGESEQYGNPDGRAPASIAPLDGLDAIAQLPTEPRMSSGSQPSVLLYPPLAQDPDLVGLRIKAAAMPAGPGPGIVDAGRSPLVPEGGGGMRSPPGSLPAWLSYQSNGSRPHGEGPPRPSAQAVPGGTRTPA